MTSNSGKFDLLMQGGHVIDPANEVDGPADVGIRDRKIAAVGPGLSSMNAEKIVDVTGLLVTPGLIDIHSHHFGYMAWILRIALAHPAFDWVARRPGDWRRRPDDWPSTRYEQKNRSGGKGPIFLRFRRRTRK